MFYLAGMHPILADRIQKLAKRSVRHGVFFGLTYSLNGLGRLPAGWKRRPFWSFLAPLKRRKPAR